MMPMKKRFISGWLILAALFLIAGPAPAKPPRQQGNRFLFIVNTSSSMRRYSKAAVVDIVNLIGSDMQGEFREGDTLGLWTYDNALHTEFPMQIWSAAARESIAADMVAYLAEQDYENPERLEKVMPALNQVIKASDKITVILISDGHGEIQGTPFDKDLHNLQKKYARELRSTREPFVTVLVARNGAVYDYTVNYPGPIAIPHTALPLPEKPAVTNAPVVAAAPPPVIPRPIFPREDTNSLIMIRPAPAPAAAPAPATTPPPEKPAPSIAQTPPAAPAQPAPPATPVAKAPPIAQAALIAQAPPVAQAAPAPAPAPAAQSVVAAAVAKPNPPPAPVEAAPQVEPPRPAEPVAPATPTATTAAATSWSTTGVVMFVAAILLLTIAIVLVAFLVRRFRTTPPPSLISQSINRRR